MSKPTRFKQGTMKERNDLHSVKSASERLIKALSKRKFEKLSQEVFK